MVGFGYPVYFTGSHILLNYLAFQTFSFDFFFGCFNATFSNMSAISWRPDLVVEEAGIPGENHRHKHATGKLYHLWLRVECTLLAQ